MGRIVNCGAVTLIALACVAGCEKSGTESSDAGPRAEVQAVADKPVDALLADLTGPELDKRVVACEALARKPASELKPVVKQLRKALKNERSPNIQLMIREAIRKAGG